MPDQSGGEGPPNLGHSCLLALNDVATGYGNKQILNGVSVNINAGEIVAIVGHNGAGKSTLLKAAFGLLPIWSGQVNFEGKTVVSPNPLQMLQAGVAYVTQGNRVFTELTVRENLEVSGITFRNKQDMGAGLDRAMNFFPALRARASQRAGSLSGGEKQMLALGSAMVLSPRLMLLDEPSLGLAPQLAAKAFQHLERICHDFQTAILVVEQKVREVLKIAQRVYVLRNGEVSFEGSAKTLDDTALREVYF